MTLDAPESPQPAKLQTPKLSRPWSAAFHTEAANTLQALLESGKWETNPMTKDYTKKRLEERIRTERGLALEKAQIAQKEAKFGSAEFHEATADLLQAHLDDGSYQTHPDLQDYTKIRLTARIASERALAKKTNETELIPSELLDGFHPETPHLSHQDQKKMQARILADLQVLDS